MNNKRQKMLPRHPQEEEPRQVQVHFVYIVRCRDGSLYTGYAQDVKQRIAAHNAGIGAKYTRGRGPVLLLASWLFESKGEALRAEHAIKRLSRTQKLRLIEGGIELSATRSLKQEQSLD